MKKIILVCAVILISAAGFTIVNSQPTVNSNDFEAPYWQKVPCGPGTIEEYGWSCGYVIGSAAPCAPNTSHCL